MVLVLVVLVVVLDSGSVWIPSISNVSNIFLKSLSVDFATPRPNTSAAGTSRTASKRVRSRNMGGTIDVLQFCRGLLLLLLLLD